MESGVRIPIAGLGLLIAWCGVHHDYFTSRSIHLSIDGVYFSLTVCMDGWHGVFS